VQILDDLLSNHIFNIFFTVFCFAILINGSNFLDGLNILTSGYFLLVLIFLIFLNSQFDIRFDYIDEVKILIIALSIFVFFNLFGYCYLGDGGVYLLSTIIGFILINLFNSNIYISPYFIVLLLWYPAFENLFSLTRRLYLKTKVSNPDKLHLHQLIYRYFILKKIFNKKILNSFTSLIILIYNLLIFSISIKYYFHTKTLLALIILNLIIYILLYNFLSKKFVSKK
jgi:UDP-N-acetylmuramyl pentapeptide phosphotransferase/UDP-N-acetylglucosamine-1-phosphate transferase